MNLKPDWVSLMIGINDIWRQFDTPTIPEQHVYPAEYRENLCEMLERTLPVVKGVILMSPYYMELNREDPMRKMTDDYLIYRYPAYISWDRVHPGEIGSMIIAREFLKSVGMDRTLI